MGGKRQISRRNQRMDLYKGAAVYGVIAIHVLFPGSFGSGVRALARFCVPFFFLTAGYFNLGASTRALLRRSGRTARQLLLACVPYLLLGAVLTLRSGSSLWPWLRSLFTADTLSQFLRFHTIPLPYAWQLWFLGALLSTYLLWWAISTLAEAARRPVPYDALAVLAAGLLLLHLIFGEGFGLMGRATDNQLLRNAMLDGFPFFALGSWAAWRRHSIRSWNLPWHWLMLGGALLSLLEAKLAGKQELYLGTLILLAGMMGRCIRYRRVSGGPIARFLQFCGQTLTLPIFVLHMLILALIREIPALAWLNRLSWALPVVVAVLSTLAALALSWCWANFLKRRHSR